MIAHAMIAHAMNGHAMIAHDMIAHDMIAHAMIANAMIAQAMIAHAMIAHTMSIRTNKWTLYHLLEPCTINIQTRLIIYDRGSLNIGTVPPLRMHVGGTVVLILSFNPN